MDTKEFLEKVRSERVIIRLRKDEIRQLEADIVSIKSPGVREKVSTYHIGDISDLLIRLEGRMEKAAKELKTLLEMEEEAVRLISKERDESRERYEMLYRYYILNESIKGIAKRKYIDARWVYKQIDSGCEDIDRILREEEGK